MKNSAQIQLFALRNILKSGGAKKQAGGSFFGNLFSRIMNRPQGRMAKTAISRPVRAMSVGAKGQNAVAIYFKALKTMFAKKNKPGAQPFAVTPGPSQKGGTNKSEATGSKSKTVILPGIAQPINGLNNAPGRNLAQFDFSGSLTETDQNQQKLPQHRQIPVTGRRVRLKSKPAGSIPLVQAQPESVAGKTVLPSVPQQGKGKTKSAGQPESGQSSGKIKKPVVQQNTSRPMGIKNVQPNKAPAENNLPQASFAEHSPAEESRLIKNSRQSRALPEEHFIKGNNQPRFGVLRPIPEDGGQVQKQAVSQGGGEQHVQKPAGKSAVKILPALRRMFGRKEKTVLKAQNDLISKLTPVRQNEEFRQFVKEISARLETQNRAANSQTPEMPDQKSYKTFFSIGKMLQHKKALRQTSGVIKVQTAPEIELILKKQERGKPVIVRVDDKKTAAQLKKNMRLIQNLGGEKIMRRVKFEILPPVKQSKALAEEPAQNTVQINKNKLQPSVQQKGAQIPALNVEKEPAGVGNKQPVPPLLQKKNKIKKSRTTAPAEQTNKRQLAKTQNPAQTTPPVQRTNNDSALPAQEKEVKHSFTDTGNDEQNKTLRGKPELQTQSAQRDQLRPMPEISQASKTRFDGLAGKLQEIIQKYDWTKKRLGLKTSFRIEKGPVGKMEIQFKEQGKDKKVQIFVESESARAEIRKVLPQIQHSLSEKGIELQNVQINISSFATTPEQFRESQKHKTRQSIRSTNREEVADENPEPALKQRKFGYNTMEVIA